MDYLEIAQQLEKIATLIDKELMNKDIMISKLQLENHLLKQAKYWYQSDNVDYKDPVGSTLATVGYGSALGLAGIGAYSLFRNTLRSGLQGIANTGHYLNDSWKRLKMGWELARLSPTGVQRAFSDWKKVYDRGPMQVPSDLWVGRPFEKTKAFLAKHPKLRGSLPYLGAASIGLLLANMRGG